MHKSKKDAIQAQIKKGIEFHSYKQFADAAGVGRSTAVKYNSLYGGISPLINRAHTKPKEAQAIKAATRSRSIREFAKLIKKPYKSACDYVAANPSIRATIANNASQARRERQQSVIDRFDTLLVDGMEMRKVAKRLGHSASYYYKCCRELGVTPYRIRGKEVVQERKVSTMSSLLSRPLVGVVKAA